MVGLAGKEGNGNCLIRVTMRLEPGQEGPSIFFGGDHGCVNVLCLKSWDYNDDRFNDYLAR